ncbi:MAG: Flp pilus assembly protein CpaB [Actinomycetota bacterium]|nr:Flp pilus assembly protein CpaB [Actinomycetota bacterium]
MEAAQRRTPPRQALRRFVGTRRGAMAVAAATAALAGLVLLAFVNNYKHSVRGGNAAASVIVADRLIPKGTAGSAVLDGRLFRPAQVTEAQVKGGALADAGALKDRVATRDIYPGQQIAAADFAAGSDPVRGQITGLQRAISLPLDSSHGLVGDVRTGDHVDVLAGFNATDANSGRGRPELRTLLQNVLVLKAPDAAKAKLGAGGSTSSADILVRASDRDAAALAFASDNGKLWFVLRPPAGASAGRPASVTLDAILSAPAITVDRKRGGR